HQFDPFVDRRNRFLNHLLARFGESFSTDFLIKFGSAGNGYFNQDPEKLEQQLIRAKIEFLTRYVTLSKSRAQGFNYTGGGLESENISVLQKRVNLFLNIEDLNLRSLVEPLAGAEVEEVDETNLSVTSEDHEFKATEEADPVNYQSFQSEEIDYSEGFIFPNQEENFLHELLVYGKQDSNFQILESEDSADVKILFSSPRSRDQQLIYVTDSRSSAEAAIQELQEYLDEVNTKCEGFHILEHILLRRTSQEKYGFNLLDDNNDFLMTSFSFAEMNTQRVVTDDLLITGIKPENYEIKSDGKRSFRILLKDEEKNPVAVVVERFEQKSEAQAKIADIIDYLNSLRKGNTAIYSKIEFFTQEKKDLLIKDDFYSLRMSAFFPAWPARFQNGDFRKLAEKIIQDNAPAHLVCDAFWLEIEEMEEFEELYFKWLELKNDPHPKQPDLDDQSYALIEFIQRIKQKAK
ncbi:MAG: hypothetical protein AAFV80_02045, partial [Bacteroidota bacterium]